MEICLKNTLRTLRQQKNVTQEALAQHLGITPQSVGKWERGEGYPDITLLPAIAAYFDVTIDDLLDVGTARKEEKYRAYEAEAIVLAHDGRVEEKIALWERAYQEFPNDCRIMKNLMGAIHSRGRYPTPDADAERIYSLGEKILKNSTDQKIREDVIFTLCHVHSSRDEKEEALKYAELGGSMYTTREDMRAEILDGEEGIEECQKYLIQLLHQAAFAASGISNKTALSIEETVQLYRFGIDLWNLLFSDGNVGFYANDIAWRYYMIAQTYANDRNTEKTLEALSSCVDYSIRSVMSDCTCAQPYTAPLVNRVTYDPADGSKNYTGNACDIYYKRLSIWQKFDFLREDARFIALQNRMREYAEEEKTE